MTAGQRPSRFDAPAREYMTTPAVTIPAHAQLTEADLRLSERGVTSLVVVDGHGCVVGAISRTDLLRVGRLRSTMAGAPRLLTLPHEPVSRRMITAVETVTPETSLREAARVMVARRIHRVFVVVNRSPVGVLSTQDLLRAITDERVTTPISHLMVTPVLTIEIDQTVARATDQLGTAHIHGLVVVENGWPVGVFTQAEALAARALPPETPVEQGMSCALLCLPVDTPMHRAAGFLGATQARRLLAVEARTIRGILTGLDLARVAAG